MKNLKYLLSLATAFVVSNGVAFADPINVVNGDFSTGDFTGYTLTGNTDYTSVQSDGADAFPYSAYLGAVGSDAILSQTFADTPGDTIDFSFYLLSDGDTANDFSASVDNTTFFSASNLTEQDFTEYDYTFVGTGQDTVTFTGRNDPGYLQLAGVAVVDNTLASTPEPSAILFLGTGLLGVAGAVRLKIGLGIA